MAAGAPAAFQSENTRVRPPIIDVFHVRSSSTARHTKCNSRQTRRGSASPQSAHTSSSYAFQLILGLRIFILVWRVSGHKKENEKALRETQALRAGCSKAELKNFAPTQGVGRPKFNQLEMVTTFTYKQWLK